MFCINLILLVFGIIIFERMIFGNLLVMVWKVVLLFFMCVIWNLFFRMEMVKVVVFGLFFVRSMVGRFVFVIFLGELVGMVFFVGSMGMISIKLLLFWLLLRVMVLFVRVVSFFISVSFIFVFFFLVVVVLWKKWLKIWLCFFLGIKGLLLLIVIVSVLFFRE